MRDTSIEFVILYRKWAYFLKQIGSLRYMKEDLFSKQIGNFERYLRIEFIGFFREIEYGNKSNFHVHTGE